MDDVVVVIVFVVVFFVVFVVVVVVVVVIVHVVVVYVQENGAGKIRKVFGRKGEVLTDDDFVLKVVVSAIVSGLSVAVGVVIFVVFIGVFKVFFVFDDVIFEVAEKREISIAGVFNGAVWWRNGGVIDAFGSHIA